jgi:hypothetical protein
MEVKMDMHHKFTIVFIENVIAGCSASFDRRRLESGMTLRARGGGRLFDNIFRSVCGEPQRGPWLA